MSTPVYNSHDNVGGGSFGNWWHSVDKTEKHKRKVRDRFLFYSVCYTKISLPCLKKTQNQDVKTEVEANIVGSSTVVRINK